ncbi:MAG: iron-containing alcohol dehydrogenase, partial [Gammaproteobacteria bacterium]
AMVHAIEAYTSLRLKNPLSDMLAREALRLLATNIERAVFSPADVEARGAMLLGAMYAGQAFANAPVAAVHALAYPLGGNYHISHGLSNSLVLPHVLRFNEPAAEPLYRELLPLVRGAAAASDSASHLLAEHFLSLARRLGIATQLREMNIPQADLPRLAAEAMLQQRLLVNNPRGLSETDALAIYEQAF